MILRTSGVLAVFGLLLVLLSAPVEAACPLEDVRFSHQSSHTRLVLDMSTETSYRFNVNGDSAVLTLRNMLCEELGGQLNFRGTYIQDTEWRKARAASAMRLYLHGSAPVKFKHFALAPNKKRNYRIVIDVLPDETRTADTTRPVLIAVDAGHGGRDSGAISVLGYQEKDLVLKLARALNVELNSRPGLQGMLIREDDTYLSLGDRVRRARLAGADIFLSIHGDAFTNPRVHGIAVYALSATAASKAITRHLVDSGQEGNAIVPGVTAPSAAASETLQAFLPSAVANLSMRFALARSVKMGEYLLDSLSKVGTIRDTQIKQAGFAVLKPIDVPSLLVEVGFLSNKKDARLLKRESYQRKLVDAMASGLEEYLRNEPPVGSYFASLKKE